MKNPNKNQEPRPWYSFKAQADATEILIYDQIGKDYWTGTGIDSKEFLAQLDSIPKGQKIVVGINSPGGAVTVGLAIYNALERRKEDVTCRIDGIAASIASVIMCAGSKCESPSNGILMIHKPFGYCEGTDEDMEKAAESLQVHAKSMAKIYAKKCKKSEDEMMELMESETWMNADEANKFGFVDSIIDPIDATALCKFDLSAYGHAPAGIGSINASAITQNKKEPPMEPNTTTQAAAQPQPATTQPQAAPIDVNAVMARLQSLEAEARRKPIEDRVDRCIASCRIPQALRQHAIDAAIKDVKTLEGIEAIEPMAGFSNPSPSIHTVSADWRNVRDNLVKHFGNKSLDPKSRHELAVARAQLFRKERAKIENVLAFTNTMDSDLQLNSILQITIEDFARMLAPLRAFSTNLGSVQLDGADTVVVKYYALDSTASTTWSSTDGYVAGNTTTGEKHIAVNLRKYQGLGYSSSELARQPYFSTVDLMRQKVAKLAYDVWADVCGLVLATTYTNTPYTKAGADFTSNDLVILAGQADDLYWPDVPGSRSFVCKTAYKTSLLQETVVKTASAIGSTEPIREAKLSHISGFDIYGAPLLPNNSEYLGAFAAFKSAILVAMAPIKPADSVMAVTYRYDTIVDPDTGITFEFREIGDAYHDTGGIFVEANYGKAAGEAKALIRVTTQ